MERSLRKDFGSLLASALDAAAGVRFSLAMSHRGRRTLSNTVSNQAPFQFSLPESRETATPENVVLRHWSPSFGLAFKTGLHRALNLNVRKTLVLSKAMVPSGKANMKRSKCS